MFGDEQEDVSREDAISAFESGNPAAVRRALFGLIQHEPDAAWIQEWCARLGRHSEPIIRATVATGIAQLARSRGKLNRRSILLLRNLRRDPATREAADQALTEVGATLRTMEW